MKVLARRKDWLHVREICATGGGEFRKAECCAQCYDNSTNDIRPTEKTILKLKQIDK